MRRGTTSLFGYRDYTLLWIGQTFSLIGSSSSWVAYPLLVLALTGAAALALGQLVYWQLVIVAFVERTLTILFAPAETAALSRIVPPAQISAAVARNDARENTAGVVGPPLGGLLFGVARLAPFAVDAASYLVSLVTVLALRTPLAPEPIEKRTRLRHEVGAGVAFIW